MTLIRTPMRDAIQRILVEMDMPEAAVYPHRIIEATTDLLGAVYAGMDHDERETLMSRVLEAVGQHQPA